MAKERLQKLLAQANIASRRASEDLITTGRVRVNGAVATLGDKADPETDVVEVDGARLKFDAQPHVYILLNKPKHVLTTDKPHRTDKRQTVMDLIGRKEHLFSVGRLDADSEGMVVMTNDGDLAQRLSHPRYRHTKTYKVEVLGLPTAETLERWQQGIFLEDGKTAPCFVEIVHGSVKGSVLRVVMTEGKKRQIRRVAGALGHPVRRLTRTHIGRLALGDLAPGQWRELTAKDVLALKTPAPEISLVKAQQPSRKPADQAAETPQAEMTDRRRPPRRKPTEETGDASKFRRAPERKPRRRPDDTSSDNEQRPRRAPYRKPAESSDDAQKPRRAPYRKPAESSDDAQRPRRAPYRKPAESSDDAQKPRRAPSSKPRSRKPEDHDDKWGKPTPPGGRKPGRTPNREPRDRKDRRS